MRRTTKHDKIYLVDHGIFDPNNEFLSAKERKLEVVGSPCFWVLLARSRDADNVRLVLAVRLESLSSQIGAGSYRGEWVLLYLPLAYFDRVCECSLHIRTLCVVQALVYESLPS